MTDSQKKVKRSGIQFLFFPGLLILLLVTLSILLFDHFQKNLVPGEYKIKKQREQILRDADRYLPLLIRFQLVERLFTPSKPFIREAYLDSMQIPLDSLIQFTIRLDSLDNEGIEEIYKKYEKILDTLRLEDSLKVKLPRYLGQTEGSNQRDE